MNKEEWKKKIEHILTKERNYCELNWSDKEWELWNYASDEDSPLSPDQQALLAACEELGIEPYPSRQYVIFR